MPVNILDTYGTGSFFPYRQRRGLIIHNCGFSFRSTVDIDDGYSSYVARVSFAVKWPLLQVTNSGRSLQLMWSTQLFVVSGGDSDFSLRLHSRCLLIGSYPSAGSLCCVHLLASHSAGRLHRGSTLSEDR